MSKLLLPRRTCARCAPKLLLFLLSKGVFVAILTFDFLNLGRLDYPLRKPTVKTFFERVLLAP